MNKDKVFLEGDRLSELGKFSEAFAIFEKGATAGDLSCMNRVAVMYFDGEGVDQSYKKSIEWDYKSIELGDETAMSNLAATYRTLGDFENAEHWFKKAISKTNGGAALELAKLYLLKNEKLDEVRSLLSYALSNNNICEADIEEAKQLLLDI